MKFLVYYTGRKFQVEFKRYRKHREWFPKPAVMATVAVVKENYPAPGHTNCTICGFGIAFLSRKDMPNRELGQRIALGRAIKGLGTKAFRDIIWKGYLRHFPVRNRQ